MFSGGLSGGTGRLRMWGGHDQRVDLKVQATDCIRTQPLSLAVPPSAGKMTATQPGWVTELPIPLVWSLLGDQFGDLDGVEGGAFAELVAGDPEADAAVVG